MSNPTCTCGQRGVNGIAINAAAHCLDCGRVWNPANQFIGFESPRDLSPEEIEAWAHQVAAHIVGIMNTQETAE